MTDNRIGVKFNLNDFKINSTNTPQKINQTLVKQEPSKSILSKPDTSEVKEINKGNSATTISFQESKPTTYTVKKGDTLSSIAKELLGKESAYMELFQLNKSKSFSHPNSILKVGTVLKLPTQSENKETNKTNSLSQYQKQNPLSYVTLNNKNKEVELPEENLSVEDKQTNEQFYSQFTKKKNTIDSTNNIVSNDAVKVNRTFNLHPTFNTKTMKDVDKWLNTVANTLENNNASINIGANGKSVKIDSDTLKNITSEMTKNKANGVSLLKEVFNNSGTAFNNGLYAIDDVVNNLKNDPYYGEIKNQEKTFDLASVSEDFSLSNDKKSYTAGLLSHGHRQVPLILKNTGIDSNQGFNGKTSEELINSLSKHFDSKGVMKNPKGFESDVYKMLDNQHARRVLIEHFDLNSKENIDSLIPAITAEGGAAKSQQDYDSYFAVGSVMINRTLGKNLKNAALGVAKGSDLGKIKPVTIKSIIYEKGQFEIAWRNQNGATIYDNHKSLNNMFKKGQLKEGNSKASLELSYEVTKDLFSGMNKISATVDGVSVKNSGRSTSDLFYFNQSRNKDYSQGNENSAVALIDKNNTHVFFKAWDDIAYFR